MLRVLTFASSILLAGCATTEPDYAVKMWYLEDGKVRMEVKSLNENTNIDFDIIQVQPEQ